ncbi:MAG: hypothetical protein FJX62_06090 [Alphaproteobacteria bacterium]|nr:hypothetical protein [Alphaproteobacteria bacterium]
MQRVVRIGFLAAAMLVGCATVPPMLPESTGLTGAGAAMAQAQPSGLSMLNPMTIIRMGKSRTQGPGMKVLEKDAEKFCVDCHRGHRRSAKRTRSASR